MYIEIYADILFLIAVISEGISLWLIVIWEGEKIRWNRWMLGSVIIALGGVATELLLRTVGIGWRGLTDLIIRLPVYHMVYGVRGRRRTFSWYLGQKLVYIWLGGLLYLIEGQKRISLSVVLILLITGGGSLYLVLRARRRRERLETILYTVEISRKGKQCICTALLDTGNQLYYRNQQPVILITSQIAEQLGVCGPFGGMDYRVIPYRSVGCEGGILHGFVCDRLVIRERNAENRKEYCWEKVIAGVTDHPLSGEGQYQMLLHPLLMREE